MKYKIILEDYGEFAWYYIYYKRLLFWYPVMDWVHSRPRYFTSEEEARSYARRKFNKPTEKQ